MVNNISTGGNAGPGGVCQNLIMLAVNQKGSCRLKDMEKLEDIKLVELSVSGDNDAFAHLVRSYQKLVYNVIYQMVKSHETAADLTQETFLKAYRGLSTFRTGSRFKPWLLRIATNTTLNYIRDNRKAESLDSMLEDNPQLEPPARDDVELTVDWKLSQAMLKEALHELPARQRHVFVLRYQYDLSYEDIATVMETTTTAIKPLLFRVREKLRMLLKGRMTVGKEGDGDG